LLYAILLNSQNNEKKSVNWLWSDSFSFLVSWPKRLVFGQLPSKRPSDQSQLTDFFSLFWEFRRIA
ncbi:MAG: hypothetical protein AAFU60_01700, partial [Bacteroidota bacterium]